MLTVSPWTPPPNSSTPRAEPERDGFAGRWRRAGQTNVKRLLRMGNVTDITGRDDGATTRSCPRKKGRAVLRGRPLRGPPCKHTDLFDQPCDRPHRIMPPHRGLPGFRALAAALRCSRALSGL